MSFSINYFDEPKLTFGHGQSLVDPRDGLTLFSPYAWHGVYGLSYGLIGTEQAISRFYKWHIRLQREIVSFNEEGERLNDKLWVPFPGFREAFEVEFSSTATKEIIIDENKIKSILSSKNDLSQRVFNTVTEYLNQMSQFERDSEESIKIWFVLVSEDIYAYCRPKSKGYQENVDEEILYPWEIRRSAKATERIKTAQKFKQGQSSWIPEHQKDYQSYEYSFDFRRQLKCRRILEGARIPIQVLRETTMAPEDFLDSKGSPLRRLEPTSQVAWNLSSTIFYKAGGKPWCLNGVRKGVCYLGIVFKHLGLIQAPQYTCCAAQMFLDTGEGAVFKGAIGPWKSLETHQFHLDESTAKEIIENAVVWYKTATGGYSPKEIFIHGKITLDEHEWNGFNSVNKDGINVVGVRIGRSDLMIFRNGRYPILRGAYQIINDRSGLLWTTGFVPRLGTYPFAGFPKPLDISIVKGKASIDQTLKDIFSLTKLNYNACHYGDGMPITLQFANMIGEILTAGPVEKNQASTAFKYYI